jgi:flagellar protein FliS
MTLDQQAHRYREVAVKTANPLQLVVILYDGAIHALKQAQEHMQRKDISARSRCINRSVAIISELQACLNLKEGGEIASSLDRLYDYMKHRIFRANFDQRPEPLAEVVVLLENLRSAWSELVSLHSQAEHNANPVAPSRSALPQGNAPSPSSLSVTG